LVKKKRKLPKSNNFIVRKAIDVKLWPLLFEDITINLHGIPAPKEFGAFKNISVPQKNLYLNVGDVVEFMEHGLYITVDKIMIFTNLEVLILGKKLEKVTNNPNTFVSMETFTVGNVMYTGNLQFIQGHYIKYHACSYNCVLDRVTIHDGNITSFYLRKIILMYNTL